MIQDSKVDRMQKLNVSFLSGLITTRDAMSNVCRQHMEAIYAWGLQRGINVEVRIYAAKAEIHDPRIIEVENAATIIADDHFQRSQLVIGEFGCIFGLFDAIHFAPPWAKTVVCYHGLTPPAVMPRHMAEALRASYRQAGTMLGVDQIITQSNVPAPFRSPEALAGFEASLGRLAAIVEPS